MFEERRKPIRVMWVSPGSIVLASGGERPCIVSDLSNGSAKLIELSEEIPDEFMLKRCPSRGPPRACRVVWRVKRQADVQFSNHFRLSLSLSSALHASRLHANSGRGLRHRLNRPHKSPKKINDAEWRASHRTGQHRAISNALA
jgi:hypothetical protein